MITICDCGTDKAGWHGIYCSQWPTEKNGPDAAATAVEANDQNTNHYEGEPIMTIIADTTGTRHDPMDEVSALYLDAHPEVRNLFPSWAEDIAHVFEDGNLAWSYGITRGEVEVCGSVLVDDDGSARIERPIVFLPGDNEDWQQEPAHLVGRLRQLAADLRSIANRIEAGA